MKTRTILNVAILSFMFAAVGLQSSQAGESIRQQARKLVNQHKYQEAAWVLSEAGKEKKANAILNDLETILRSDHKSDKKLGGGQSSTYLLEFENSVKGVFKVNKSQPAGPNGGYAGIESAVYEIDRYFGFNLTPFTITRYVKLKNADCSKLPGCPDDLYGSVQYFVSDTKTALDLNLNHTHKSDRLKFFDAIIGSYNRSTKNWLVDANGRQIAIDHNMSFGYSKRYNQWHRPSHSCWEEDVDAIADPSSIEDLTDKYEQVARADLFALLIEDVRQYEIIRFFDHQQKIIERLKDITRWRSQGKKPEPWQVC